MVRPLLFATLLAASASASACSAPSPSTSAAAEPQRRAHAPATQATPQGEGDLAYFAGGCFWGVEHYLEQLDGVLDVDSGYMGGHVESPSYDDVSSQTSGHVETVRVRFDPTRVSYEEIARRFFEIHDPTQADGQGPDIGPEYRSVVFYATPEQRRTAEALIELLRARGYEVVTRVEAADRFWEAEAYHQDHYAKTGRTPYCHARVRRFDS